MYHLRARASRARTAARKSAAATAPPGAAVHRRPSTSRRRHPPPPQHIQAPQSTAAPALPGELPFLDISTVGAGACLACSSQVDLAQERVSFLCKKGSNSGKRFRRCRQQYCFSWIWEEQLSKYVNEMVIHKTAAEIRVLPEALEVASNQVQHKEDQIRARDEQLELALAQIASLKTTVEETGTSLNTLKMLFWGLIFLFAVGFVALIQM
nr:uncharacterized protein LOC127330036 [Lolium perenne]